ncbi:CsxC family protein [Halobacillus mangrovi]|uniref:DUF3794 domain-containing protein n=1 Tax=Halobacillus mangrovi TaxID=402384 RepID=A0A1W5ZZ66_9BACI|nr:DUF3794 domain-containing protein [Halobacillus mangrovi]ARI78656.1 DUF3794 domain-containing protein [Halobacillus mangrovi]
MKKDNHHDCVDLSMSASVEQCMSSRDAETAITDTRQIRVPVKLGTYDVTTHLVADIKFPHPVMEIKDIKKRVIITQCRLMTRVARPTDPSSVGPFPLFLEGYVRKNIQYASPCHNDKGECVSAELKSLTVKIPFKCFTQVTLEVDAILPVTNTRSEFDFFRAQDLGKGFPEKDKFLSSDISQFHQASTGYYNDLPFCELVSHDIIEWDEATDRKSINGGYGDDSPVDEGFFHHMVEKMTLTFRVRVLQEQLVEVNNDNGTA